MPDVPDQSPPRRRGGPEFARDLRTRLAVIRNHRRAAAIGFTLACGAIMFWTLRATPKFEAQAMLTIERTGARTRAKGVAGNLADLERIGRVETERRVVHSFRVARGAARILTGVAAYPPAGAEATGAKEPIPSSGGYRSILVEEVNAYRPWEALLRRLELGKEPLHLAVEIDELPTGHGHSVYLFEFDDSAVLTIIDVDREESERVGSLRFGEPVEAFGRSFILSEPDGNVAARKYRVTASSLGALATRIHTALEVQKIERFSDALEITVAAATPLEAQSTAGAVAESYLALKRLRREETAASNEVWLSKEIERLKTELGPAEQALDEYVADAKAMLLQEQTEATLKRQEKLLTQLADLDRDATLQAWKRDRLLKAKEQSIERQVVLLGELGSNMMTPGLVKGHAELKRELGVMLRAGGVETSAQVQEKRGQIEEIRKDLQDMLQIALEEQLDNQEQLLAGLKAERTSLQGEYDKNEQQLSALPAVERGLTKREGTVDMNRKIFRRFTEMHMEMKIAGASGRIAAALVDTARLPEKRSSPNLSRMGLLAVFLGLLVGAGLPFLLESLDGKVRNVQQLEEGTGLTAYGSIPDFGSVSRRDRATLKGSLITIEKPSSIVTESYRALRASIRFASPGQAVKTLAITSAVAQEGKTTVTCNLAVVSAQAGSRVLVVDADLRRPSTHLVFGHDRTPGLSEVLLGDKPWNDVLSATEVDGLTVLHAGRPIEDPGALLGSEAFVQLLGELAERFDYVFVDVPPTLVVADASSFFRALDGVLLLARSGVCTLDTVNGAREQMERLGARILGTVLNAYDLRTARRSGGYGGYGGYGYYDRTDTDASTAVRSVSDLEPAEEPGAGRSESR